MSEQAYSTTVACLLALLGAVYGLARLALRRGP